MTCITVSDWLLQALQRSGWGHVLDSYMVGLEGSLADCEELREIQYEAAARNCVWDLDLPARY